MPRPLPFVTNHSRRKRRLTENIPMRYVFQCAVSPASCTAPSRKIARFTPLGISKVRQSMSATTVSREKSSEYSTARSGSA